MRHEATTRFTAQAQPLPAASEPALRLAGVGKQYGSFAALRDVDLALTAGSFVTLLGPSGSGKTTLLMIVAGFTVPTTGQVMAAGRDITSLPPERREFGVVFQSYALFPNMTVAGNVAFPLRVRGVRGAEAARRVREALDMVQLGSLAERRPAQLSGGQQQRVALARALVYRPSVLLLDEPLTALDRALRDRMQTELKALHRAAGTTFVMVTHDQEEALALSDTLVVMAEGRVQQVGTPVEVFRRPANRFVAGFLGAANLIPATVLGMRGGDAALRLPDGQTLKMPAGSQLESGQEAVLMLRPEACRPVAPGDVLKGEQPVIECRVVERIFTGTGWRLNLDHRGTPIELRTADAELAVPGRHVPVALDLKQGWVVP